MKNKASGTKPRAYGARSTRRRSNVNRSRRQNLLFEPLEKRDLLAGDLLSDFDFGPPEEPVAPSAHSAEFTAMTATNVAEGESAAEGEDAPDLVEFAKALDAAGVKFYGAAWCPACTAQKELFEDGSTYLPFVEVTNPDRSLNQTGIDQGITQFPTWDIPDPNDAGSTIRLIGTQSLETLSQTAGIAIPSSSTPSIRPIDDVTLLDNSPLYIALDGYDPNGGPLTYTIESDNALVIPMVIQGNRSAIIDVAGFGKMNFQLFDNMAPRPADRFSALAQADFYDGISFHRIIDGFVIQGGDPTGTGSGGSSMGDFDDQFHVNLQHNTTGYLSYAKSGDDTNDSQFFITEGPSRHLDFNHSIFGFMVEGEANREAISNTAVTNSVPNTPVTMQSVDIFTDTENAVLQLLVMQPSGGEAEGQSGEANITVTVTNSDNVSVQETFNVQVAPDAVNGGPFLEDIEPVTAVSGEPVQIQLVGVDVEGDPISYSGSSVDGNATVVVDAATGLVTVTPDQDFSGELEIFVRATATNGSNTSDTFDSQLVTIDVAPNAPLVDLLATSDSNISTDNITNQTDLVFEVSNVLAGSTVQLFSGTTLIGQTTASSDTVTIATNGLSTFGDGTYSITASQTFDGRVSAESTGLPVTLDTVAPDAFTSTPPTSATNGTEVLYDAENPEEGTAGFEYRLQNAPDGAVVDADTGVVTWTPTRAQDGMQDFQILAVDAAGNTTAQDISIDVTVIPEVVRIRVETADLANSPITDIASGQEFLLNIYVSHTTGIEAAGVFSAYLDVLFDGNLASVVGTDKNDIMFDGPYTNGTSGDFDTPGLINEAGAFGPTSPLGPPEQLLFSLRMKADQSGTLTFEADPADVAGNDVLVFGQDSIVPNGAITFGSATLTIDEGFTAVNDTFNVDEDGGVRSLDVLTNDQNNLGGTMTISNVGTTSNGGTVTIAANGQTVSYTPAADFFGEDVFTYTATNGTQSSTATVTVQVAPTNDAPTAVDDQFTVSEGTAGNFLGVLSNDSFAPDINETLRVLSTSSGSAGGVLQIAPNGTHIQYTPAANFVGTETFTYTLGDGTTGSVDTATVTVTVEENTSPESVDDTFDAVEDSSLNALDVLANDSPLVPGAAIRVAAVSQPSSGGTVTIGTNGSNVLYTPAPNFFGADTFTYTLEEQDGGVSVATVTVNVSGTNDPPTAVNDSLNVLKDGGVQTLDVLANDSDAPDDGETLQITEVTQGTEGGTVTITGGGTTIGYDPPAGFLGTDTFTYTIDDGSGETVTASVTVTVREFTPRKIEGQIFHFASGVTLGGLDVTLVGTDAFDQAVQLTVPTTANGIYSFGDLAPGNYDIIKTQPKFLLTQATELNVTSDIDDTDSIANNFTLLGRQPKFLSIADFMAIAPRQTSLSPTNSILAAVDVGGEDQWFSIETGWEGFSDASFNLSADASELTITVSNGTVLQGTIPTTNPSRVRFLGTDDGAQLLRITGGPDELNLQPVTSGGESEGEAEGEQQAIAVNATNVAPATDVTVDPVQSNNESAEGEFTPADPIAVTPVPHSVTDSNAAETIDLVQAESSTIATSNAAQDSTPLSIASFVMDADRRLGVSATESTDTTEQIAESESVDATFGDIEFDAVDQSNPRDSSPSREASDSEYEQALEEFLAEAGLILSLDA